MKYFKSLYNIGSANNIELSIITSKILKNCTLGNDQQIGFLIDSGILNCLIIFFG